jgi:hypothetical protein
MNAHAQERFIPNIPFYPAATRSGPDPRQAAAKVTVKVAPPPGVSLKASVAS